MTRAVTLRLLLLLALRAERDGWCRRSQGELAAELGVSRQTVSAALGRLRAAGHVERLPQRRFDGGTAACLYRLRTPCKASMTGGHGPSLVAAISVAAAAIGVDAAELLGSRGRDAVAKARRLAYYLAVVELEHSATQVAEAFSRHHSTVDAAVQAIEEEREGGAFDEMMFRLARRTQRASLAGCRLV